MEDIGYSPEEIVAMYADMTGPEIAALTGIALLTVYNIIREEGGDVRPPGHRPVLVSPGVEVLEQMLAEHSQREVGELLGVSKRTIQRWMGK